MWLRITYPSNEMKITFKDQITFLDVCSIYAPLFCKNIQASGIFAYKTILDYIRIAPKCQGFSTVKSTKEKIMNCK